MTCSGCSGAVERVLSKLQGKPLPLHTALIVSRHRSHTLLLFAWMQGVDSYDVSLESQSVVVRGSAPFDTVLEKIKKTGKEVKSSQVVR